jgi:hypothetical protein
MGLLWQPRLLCAFVWIGKPVGTAGRLRGHLESQGADARHAHTLSNEGAAPDEGRSQRRKDSDDLSVFHNISRGKISYPTKDFKMPPLQFAVFVI